jgi:sensor histidine kinase YesM
MQWHDFIFSNQWGHKSQRHFAFWFLWWVYIVFTIFFTHAIPANPNVKNQLFFHYQPGLNELGLLFYSLLVLVKSFLLIVIHFFYCYTVTYFLIPRLLLRRKYVTMLAGLIGASVLIVFTGYFLYSIVYPAIDGLFQLNKPLKSLVWVSIDASLINAIKVSLVASAITLLKRWWLQEKEKQKIEKEKINVELGLLKTQIHPAFLFSTLDSIIKHARATSPKAPEMLIKLSDLLSYMLYECDAPKVKLEKELGMMKEYMMLEKYRQGKRLDMTFQIGGNPHGLLISPLLLLPFIDNSFSYSNDKLVEQAWVNLEITIEDDVLTMKIINGIHAALAIETKYGDLLGNVKKRLELLYPGRHELKISAEQELLMVQLNITLDHAIPVYGDSAATTKTFLSYAGI